MVFYDFLNPGVGKTTLVQKVCEGLVSSGVGLEGFYTEEVRVGGRRVGFDVVTVTGERGRLSRIRLCTYPNQTNCSSFGCHVLQLTVFLFFLLFTSRTSSGPSYGRREYTVGQYVVDVPSFESLALPLFRNVRCWHIAL